MKKVASLLLVVLVAGLILAGCAPTPAPTPTPGQTPEPGVTFPEKPITWIVPYSPGGGFDTMSRAAARVMPKYLPKEVPIVIQNIPGAGSRTGTNVLYRAKPDGYTIGILNIQGLIVTEMVMETKFDLAKFTYLGQLATDTYLAVAPKGSPYHSLEDLKKAQEPLRLGLTGAGSSAWVVNTITCSALGIPMTPVTGYPGTTEILTAILRGEIDLAMRPIASELPYIESGDMVPIFIIAFERDKSLPDVPTVEELGYPEVAGLGLPRFLAVPPDTPREIADILEKALLETLHDKSLTEWAEGADYFLAPLTGEQAMELIITLRGTLEEYKEIFEAS